MLIRSFVNSSSGYLFLWFQSSNHSSIAYASSQLKAPHPYFCLPVFRFLPYHLQWNRYFRASMYKDRHEFLLQRMPKFLKFKAKIWSQQLFKVSKLLPSSNDHIALEPTESWKGKFAWIALSTFLQFHCNFDGASLK